MEYIIASLGAILVATLIVYKLANNILGIDLRLRPLLLCAVCAMFISLVLPKIVVGFTGLPGTLAVLAIFAVIFAYFVAKYEGEPSQQTDDAESDAACCLAINQHEPNISIDAMNQSIQVENLSDELNDSEKPVKENGSQTIEAIVEPVELENWEQIVPHEQEISQNDLASESKSEPASVVDSDIETSQSNHNPDVELLREEALSIDDDLSLLGDSSLSAIQAEQTEFNCGKFDELQHANDLSQTEILDEQEHNSQVFLEECDTPAETIEQNSPIISLELNVERYVEAESERKSESELQEELKIADELEEISNTEVDCNRLQENNDFAESEILVEQEINNQGLAEEYDTSVGIYEENLLDAIVEPNIKQEVEIIEVVEQQDELVILDELREINETQEETKGIEESKEFFDDLEQVNETVLGREESQEDIMLLPEEPLIQEADNSIMVYNEQMAEVVSFESEELDDLLELAFINKEEHNYNAAFNAFNRALTLYPNSEAAPFLIVEIGNILKNKGNYDDAIKVFSDGRVLSQAKRDEMMEQEFVNTIAYLRIIKNILVQNRLGNIPFLEIPSQMLDQIDEEFREWRSVGNI